MNYILLHHHLEDPLESQHVQHHNRNVPPVPERKVSDNVCPGHSLPEQEVRDLQQLSAQGEQAVGKSVRGCCCFFSPYFSILLPCSVILLNLLLICPLVDGERGGRVEFHFGTENGMCLFSPDPVLYAWWFWTSVHMKQSVANKQMWLEQMLCKLRHCPIRDKIT